MRLAAILLAGLLAGCAGKEVVQEVVEVKILVPVPCVKSEVAKPNWLLDNPKIAEATYFDKGNTALQEIEQRRAYERELEAVIKACMANQK